MSNTLPNSSGWVNAVINHTHPQDGGPAGPFPSPDSGHVDSVNKVGALGVGSAQMQDELFIQHQS